jgi:hypothetical protein
MDAHVDSGSNPNEMAERFVLLILISQNTLSEWSFYAKVSIVLKGSTG